MMKLKQTPEDFIVEEMYHPTFSKEGKYSLYLLEKTSLDTLEAKKIIMRKFRIAYPEIGIAGLKDKHAKTTQYLSIKGRDGQRYTFMEKNISLQFIGFVEQPLKTGDLEKNKFTITVRALRKDELDKIKKATEQTKQFGVPNYFDTQRFGSLQGTSDFIAKHLIFDDFETGLKLFLTRKRGFERASVRNCRKSLDMHWGQWETLVEQCAPVAKHLREEYRVLEYLVKNQNDFVGAFKLLDRTIKELFVSAYQSFLWNECVKLLLRQKIQKLVEFPYGAGKLLFYKELSPELLEQWRTYALPMLSKKTRVSYELQRIVDRVLRKEGLTLDDLVVKKMTSLFFKERPRSMLLFPQNLAATEPEKDELNNGLYKITLSFALEKGAYATIIIKRICQL